MHGIQLLFGFCTIRLSLRLFWSTPHWMCQNLWVWVVCRLLLYMSVFFHQFIDQPFDSSDNPIAIPISKIICAHMDYCEPYSLPIRFPQDSIVSDLFGDTFDICPGVCSEVSFFLQILPSRHRNLH